jgi:AraC-like DNA-binding protein
MFQVVPDRDPGQDGSAVPGQAVNMTPLMPSIPLQFVIVLLLLIVLIRLLRREGGPPSRLFVVMIATYALQSIFYGLRWGYGIQAAALPYPFSAAIVPPLTWVAFSTLASRRKTRRWWLHLLPLLVIVFLYVFFRGLAFQAVVVIGIGYGVALIRLGRAGPDALDRVQLDGALSMQRALLATGGIVIAEALVNLAIDVDFVRAHGVHAAWIAGVSSLFFIGVLGFAAVVAGGSVPTEEEAAEPMPVPQLSAPPAPEPEDGQVMAALEAAMRDRTLYRDPELTLDRLARKLAVPARRISGAVNRTRTINVSQYVNEYRIGDACRRLADTDASITQIMFEVGFQTKSNFNREFLRVTGKSPSAWRAERRAAGAQSVQMESSAAIEEG